MQTDQSHRHALHPERGLLVLIVITMLNVGFIFYVVVARCMLVGRPTHRGPPFAALVGGTVTFLVWHRHRRLR